MKNKEQMSPSSDVRRYWLVRLMMAVWGALTAAVITLVAWRSLIIIRQDLLPTRLGCGCGIVTMHVPTVALAVAIAGLAVVSMMTASFMYSMLKHLRQNRRAAMSLRRPGFRQVWHHHLAEPVIISRREDMSALTVGLWRPRIFITESLLGRLTNSEVTAVLLHEQAHRRRRDPVWLAFMDSLAMAWARMPWLQRWVELSYSWRELAADETATGGYQHTDGLSGAILKLAGSGSPAHLTAFSPNQDRVNRLLDPMWRPTVGIWRWTYTGGLVVVGLLVSLFFRFAPVSAATIPPNITLLCHETKLICPQQERWSVSLTRCLDGTHLCANLQPMSSYGISR